MFELGMRSLLQSLAFLVVVGAGNAVEVEKSDNVTLKAPIVATPSGHWSQHLLSYLEASTE